MKTFTKTLECALKPF